jgi:hypothetical protein
LSRIGACWEESDFGPHKSVASIRYATIPSSGLLPGNLDSTSYCGG